MFCNSLEKIPAHLAKMVSEELSIPTSELVRGKIVMVKFWYSMICWG